MSAFSNDYLSNGDKARELDADGFFTRLPRLREDFQDRLHKQRIHLCLERAKNQAYINASAREFKEEFE